MRIHKCVSKSILLLGCILGQVLFATVAAQAAPVVSFIGASETSGYGLRVGEVAYPDILARRCSFRALVDAEPNKRVIFRQFVRTKYPVVLFFSQFDAVPPATSEDLAHWLGYSKNEILVESPLVLRDDQSVFGFYQQRLYALIERIAARSGATVVRLAWPRDRREFLQADGLHPNARGQKLIADDLQPTLRVLHVCGQQKQR